MTWGAHAVVTQVVTESDGLVDVYAMAKASEMHTVGEYTAPRVHSNTEGEIAEVFVVLTFEGESPLRKGDGLYVSGHFMAPDTVTVQVTPPPPDVPAIPTE